MSYVHHVWMSALTMTAQFVLSSRIVFFLDCVFYCESISIETVNFALVSSGVVSGLVYMTLCRLVYGKWPKVTGIASGVLIAVILGSVLARISATSSLSGDWAMLFMVILVLTVGYGWLRLFGTFPSKPDTQDTNKAEERIV